MTDLVERRGEVVSFAQGLAQVRLEPVPGCSSCGSRATCASGYAATQVISMPLSAPAQAGDYFTVSMPSSSVTLAAMLGYLFPPITLLLGALIAAAWFEGDAAAVLGALLGFCAGLLMVRRISGMAFAQGLFPFSCQADRHPHPQPDLQTGEHP